MVQIRTPDHLRGRVAAINSVFLTLSGLKPQRLLRPLGLNILIAQVPGLQHVCLLGRIDTPGATTGGTPARHWLISCVVISAVTFFQ
ncbi:hypothetical protein, partial [Brasilonema sp. UFV-L1]|uniref:hypothetical protein n=1 Tax=Brasilonema sp. UFV-L1 TaxID=2234130 RepID=UPI001B7D0123